MPRLSVKITNTKTGDKKQAKDCKGLRYSKNRDGAAAHFNK